MTPQAERSFRSNHDHGVDLIETVDGASGTHIVEALSDFAPDLARQISDWAYGEVYSRAGLAPRDRQLMTLGMLTALGDCGAELTIHVGAALNVGLSVDEVVEIFTQSVVFCGFPRAINGMLVAKQVCAERGGLLPSAPEAAAGDGSEEAEHPLAAGISAMSALSPTAVDDVYAACGPAMTPLADEFLGWGYGEMLSRPGLTPRDRQLVTLGMLAALGSADDLLATNIEMALNVGLTADQISEAMLHSAVYCGFPRAIHAATVAARVLPA
ncbi:MAG: carboxymuconolactone decarboxylase family protein [Microbacteriaceae bacterium]